MTAKYPDTKKLPKIMLIVGSFFVDGEILRSVPVAPQELTARAVESDRFSDGAQRFSPELLTEVPQVAGLG